MKETKRKQKHQNWVVRVPQGRRDATATQQTTQRCPKRQKNTKMRKAGKKYKRRKKKTNLYIHTHIQTHCTLKNKQTEHAAHTQFSHSLIWILDSWLLHLQKQEQERQNHGKKTRQKKTKRSEHCRHATHNTPVNRTCPRVLTLRVVSRCVGWCCAAAPAHTHTHTQRQNQRIKP